jgi:hypothetical protein
MANNKGSKNGKDGKNTIKKPHGKPTPTDKQMTVMAITRNR